MVWFLTSGSSSWWRIVGASVVAGVIFVANLGVLGDWGVLEGVRGHLEGLLPLHPVGGVAGAPLGAPAAAVPRPDPVVEEPVGEEERAMRQSHGRQGQPDPAAAARRLLDQRRHQNASWLWQLLRRIEHATLLFLASLIPGVGERHVAARVAEDAAREAANAARVADEERRIRERAERAVRDVQAARVEARRVQGEFVRMAEVEAEAGLREDIERERDGGSGVARSTAFEVGAEQPRLRTEGQREGERDGERENGLIG
jgi:hypothetical protein